MSVTVKIAGLETAAAASHELRRGRSIERGGGAHTLQNDDLLQIGPADRELAETITVNVSQEADIDAPVVARDVCCTRDAEASIASADVFEGDGADVRLAEDNERTSAAEVADEEICEAVAVDVADALDARSLPPRERENLQPLSESILVDQRGSISSQEDDAIGEGQVIEPIAVNVTERLQPRVLERVREREAADAGSHCIKVHGELTTEALELRVTVWIWSSGGRSRCGVGRVALGYATDDAAEYGCEDKS